MRQRALALVLLLAAAPCGAGAAEVCDYAGEGNHDTRISITTIATPPGAEQQIRVLWTLSARALLIFRFEYRIEEISQWRDGKLQSVALNIRHVLNGRIKRQQWDVFTRDGEGFSAWRLQGKHAAEFATQHPAFARHWDPAEFGKPWLDDHRAGNPEPRADLSLRPGEAPAGLVPPFAAGFYLPRTSKPEALRVPLFLPGNKQQNRADLAVAAPTPAPGGGHVWRVALESQKLGIERGSWAEADISPGNSPGTPHGRLLTAMRYRISGFGATAEGQARLLGCHEG